MAREKLPNQPTQKPDGLYFCIKVNQAVVVTIPMPSTQADTLATLR